MKRELVMLGSLVAIALAGCAQSQGDDRLREKAGIDAKTGQEVTDARAKEMEDRLLIQQRFFQALTGVFKGKMQIPNGGLYDVQFTLLPTIPLYQGSRIRSIDEITYDLTNLALNIEEVATAPMSGGKKFSSGCVFEHIKPKIDGGYVLATAATCPATFTLSLGSTPKNRAGRVAEKREDVSKAILDGQIDIVDEMQVEMRSVHRAGAANFSIRRVN